MRFSIGITIHNEERNIGRLLDRLQGDGLEARGLIRVVVVSSGSTDGSDRIVADKAAGWPLLTLLTEPERRGKASAINRYLEAARDSPLLVLMSGDVVPAPGATALLLDAFEDPEVGMAGGRPAPAGEPVRLVHHVARLQWDLHHEVSLRAPKLGEVVAFRNVLDAIPADTAVDEAAIEAALTAKGYRFRYVAQAIITNKGPDTLADFLKQRRRIAAGHAHLRQTSGYRVSTDDNRRVLGIVARYLARHPSQLPLAAITAGLEATGRVLGLYDLKVRGRNPFIWDIAASTKNPDGPTGRTAGGPTGRTAGALEEDRS